MVSAWDSIINTLLLLLCVCIHVFVTNTCHWQLYQFQICPFRNVTQREYKPREWVAIEAAQKGELTQGMPYTSLRTTLELYSTIVMLHVSVDGSE